MTKEVWKPVNGYAAYEVSDLGRVRSLDRQVTGFWKGKPFTKFVRGRVLKPQPQVSGHVHVNLSTGKTVKIALVHRLVLEAFVGPCPQGQESLHKDGDPTNNRRTNLHYGTRSQNNTDMYLHGRRKVGERSHLSHVSDATVRLIRAKKGSGSSRKVAAELLVKDRYVRRIWAGQIRNHT